MIINTRYLKEYGLVKTYRFSRYFFHIDDVIHYLYKIPDPEEFKVITISKEDFQNIMKWKEK